METDRNNKSKKNLQGKKVTLSLHFLLHALRNTLLSSSLIEVYFVLFDLIIFEEDQGLIIFSLVHVKFMS